MAYKGKYLEPNKRPKFLIIFAIICALLVAGCIIKYNIGSADSESKSDIPTDSMINVLDTSAPTLETIVQAPTETIIETEPTVAETEPTEPEPVVCSASIGAMGDLLMHKPIFDANMYGAEVQQPDGTYNFESVFKYIADNITTLDYAVANLETTLCGKGNGYPYSGYPSFNCPDEIVVGAKDAGFDMLLTANNHSYDTGMVGYERTVEVVRDTGLETLGTYASADERKWTAQNINGINVGMMCYTWASSETSDGRPSLNGNAYISEVGLCNYFCSNNLDRFYEEVEGYIAEMEEADVEATIMFIHWGWEYRLYANEEQKGIAQKLCDMGIDVIIGAHPHVIQPIELIESTVDPEHKTVCIYSTGNAVSNQRLGNISEVTTAHTEDGVLFSVTFEKIDDGEAYIADINVLPTWACNSNKNR